MTCFARVLDELETQMHAEMFGYYRDLARAQAPPPDLTSVGRVTEARVIITTPPDPSPLWRQVIEPFLVEEWEGSVALFEAIAQNRRWRAWARGIRIDYAMPKRPPRCDDRLPFDSSVRCWEEKGHPGGHVANTDEGRHYWERSRYGWLSEHSFEPWKAKT